MWALIAADSGAVCSFDVSPGHDGNDEGDEACADAPPSGIGLAMQPRPEFDPDVRGAHEKDQTFEADIPPVERLTLLHSLRQRLDHARKPQPARIRFELLNEIPPGETICLERDPGRERRPGKESSH